MTDTQPLSPAVSSRPAAARERAAYLALDRVQVGLLVLMVARLALDALFLLNALPLDLRDPVYRWYLHHGGDQELMLEMARSLLSGPPLETVVGIGQPLMMLPWVLILQPQAYLEIAAPLVVTNGFVLGGLSVLLVGGLARTVTRSDRAALASAAIWALHPLVTYFAFFWHPEMELLRGAYVPKVAWLNGLSDAPAIFFALLSACLLARVLRRGVAGFWPALALGALLGLTILFRFHLAPMVGCLLLTLLVFGGWRAALAALGGLLIVYLPQAWYNLAVFGTPFTTGYVSYGDMANWGGTLRRPLTDLIAYAPVRLSPASALNSVQFLVGRHAWLLLPLAGVLAITLYAVVSLKRRLGWQAVFLLLGAPLAYLLSIALTGEFLTDVVRFSMPAWPALLAAAVFTVEVAVDQLRGRAGQRASSGHAPA